jgi:hypothetical protein
MLRYHTTLSPVGVGNLVGHNLRETYEETVNPTVTDGVCAEDGCCDNELVHKDYGWDMQHETLSLRPTQPILMRRRNFYCLLLCTGSFCEVASGPNSASTASEMSNTLAGSVTWYCPLVIKRLYGHWLQITHDCLPQEEVDRKTRSLSILSGVKGKAWSSCCMARLVRALANERW